LHRIFFLSIYSIKTKNFMKIILLLIVALILCIFSFSSFKSNDVGFQNMSAEAADESCERELVKRYKRW